MNDAEEDAEKYTMPTNNKAILLTNMVVIIIINIGVIHEQNTRYYVC